MISNVRKLEFKVDFGGSSQTVSKVKYVTNNIMILTKRNSLLKGSQNFKKQW